MPKKIKKKGYRYRHSSPANEIKAVFNFTMNELGVPAPSKQDIELMENMHPKLAKQYKNFKPLDHVVTAPTTFERDPSVPLGVQWENERQRAKQHLIEKRMETMRMIEEQQKLVQQTAELTSEQPPLDLDNLTTVGEEDDSVNQD